MKTKKRFVAVLLATVLLAACAGTSTNQQIGSISAAVQAKHPNQPHQMLIVNVPSAGNPISDSMIVGMLASGTQNNSVLNLLSILAVPNVKIGVVGESSMVNQATVRRALKDFSGSSNAEIYIEADDAAIRSLNETAKAKNIRVYAARP